VCGEPRSESDAEDRANVVKGQNSRSLGIAATCEDRRGGRGYKARLEGECLIQEGDLQTTRSEEGGAKKEEMTMSVKKEGGMS